MVRTRAKPVLAFVGRLNTPQSFGVLERERAQQRAQCGDGLAQLKDERGTDHLLIQHERPDRTASSPRSA